MQIETASITDVPALIDLLSLLFTQEIEFQPNKEAQTRGLTKIIENSQIGTILIIKQDNSIVGMVNLLYTVSTALGERVAILEDMVVSPHYRSAGAGTKLLQAAIGHARQTGCKRITLLTDQSNESAQIFYGKQGFTMSTMVPLRLQL